MKTIPLTQGYFAIVDDEDHEALAAFRWHVNRDVRTIYAERKIRPVRRGPQKHVMMHRVIMNAQPGQFIDHVNGNQLDNRRCNLRFATRSQNAMNSRKQRVPRSSQYIGVTLDRACTRRPWKASVWVDCKSAWSARFSSQEEAARARDARAMELHGDFARLNFAPSFDVAELVEKQPEPNGASR